MAQEKGYGNVPGMELGMGRGLFQELTLAFSKIKKPCLQNGKQGHILFKLER